MRAFPNLLCTFDLILNINRKSVDIGSRSPQRTPVNFVPVVVLEEDLLVVSDTVGALVADRL